MKLSYYIKYHIIILSRPFFGLVDDEHVLVCCRYVSVGDIARVGTHPPNVAAIFHNGNGQFATPLGYDLVSSNCHIER